MTQKSNSLRAYFDENNQRKFKSNRQKIYWYMFDVKTPQSARMVETATGIDYYSVVRRFADLRNDGEIEYTGDIEEFGNMCSLYKIKDQTSLFPVPKKKTKAERQVEAVESLIFDADKMIEQFKGKAGSKTIVSNQHLRKSTILECLNLLKTIK